jgi:class 3 adenylate cyclase/streptogramin lyase
MAERPRGTVTFLFTDVEGSTRLLKQLRDRYGSVLGDHQRLLREAFAALGGEEVDTQGDAFFYVFSRARDAAAAAAEGQRALAAHAWPEGTELRVRMGLHTGEPNLSDDGRYHGLGVHRTARIMAAGHGGQVLASQATAAVLGDDEPEGITLRELGEHKLKDLDRPERIYQLEIDGLPTEFPPLKTHAPATPADEIAAARLPIYRRPLVIGALAGVLAAAVAIPIFALGGRSGGQSLSALVPSSVGVIDAAKGDIVDEVPDVPTPARAAAGESGIWVTSPDAQTVSRIDPQSHDVRQTIRVGSGPTGVAVGGGAVWVANTLDGTVSRIDPAVNQVVGEPIRVGNSPNALAFGEGSVWVANLDDQTLSRIHARTGVVVGTTHVDAAARGVAVGDGAVWLSDGARNRVVRVDARTGDVTQTINVGSGPTATELAASAEMVIAPRLWL